MLMPRLLHSRPRGVSSYDFNLVDLRGVHGRRFHWPNVVRSDADSSRSRGPASLSSADRTFRWAKTARIALPGADGRREPLAPSAHMNWRHRRSTSLFHFAWHHQYAGSGE